MAVLHTPTRNLPYPDGNDLIRDGDNRIHDLASALDGIIATTDDLEDIALTPGPPGPAGAAGPAGPSGQSAGKIYYFATSDPSDIAGYKTMLPSPSTGSEQTIATACTGTSDVLVAAFATDPGDPGLVDYPAGTAFRRIYANVQAGGARFHLQVYKRTAAGVETLARDEFSDTFVNQTVGLQEWIATGSAAGAVAATDRLVAKLYAQRTNGPTTVTVTTYYEGSAHTSQIQTTISAGAQGPVGPAGPPGSSGSIAASYKGAWSAATTYALNDVVLRNGSSYVALAANTNVDPATPGGEATVGSVGPAASAAFSATPNSAATPFTPASTIQVQKIKVTFWGFPAGGGTYRVGIVTGTPAAGVPPTAWVGGNAYVDAAIGATGDYTVTLPATVTLTAGTLYHVVLTNASHVGGLGYSTGTPVVTGGTGGTFRYGNLFDATSTGFAMPFTFLSTPTPVWGMLAAGIPAGGTTGQSLKKLSNTDYHVGWVT